MIASSTAAAGGLSAGLGIVWIVVLFGIMYFMMIRPQKKLQKSWKCRQNVFVRSCALHRIRYLWRRRSVKRRTATWVTLSRTMTHLLRQTQPL